jgi:ABC-2 type transport system permease protein
MGATMFRSVLTKTLHDYVRPMFGWGLGLFVTAAMMMSVYPSVTKSAPQLRDYVQNMPDAFKAMFGMQGMDYTSAAGYLNTELFSMILPACFAAFAMGAGSRAVAGEEDRKTLDLLLSTPITRTSLLLQKVVAMVLDTAALVVVLWLSLWVAGLFVSFDMGAARLLEASVNAGILGLTFGALALLVGSWWGGRGLSIGVASALLVGGFLLNSLAGLVSGLEPWRGLSPFYWYAANDPLRNGLDAVDVGVLIATSVVLVAVAAVGFNRRDLQA